MKNKPICNRIMLKFSGEALMGANDFGIDSKIINYIAEEIKPLIALNVQLGIIIGGGNFFRGKQLYDHGVDRITGDHMGMIATLLNALAMRDVFEKHNIATQVMSAVSINGIIERYDRHKALLHLENKKVLILAGGTGNPLVTTDSALSLRGIELQADLLLKATNVDYICTTDPRKNPDAQCYQHLTYKEALTKELAVMDLAAFTQCRDHNMKLRVYNMHKKGALVNIILGTDEGTLVEN